MSETGHLVEIMMLSFLGLAIVYAALYLKWTIVHGVFKLFSFGLISISVDFPSSHVAVCLSFQPLLSVKTNRDGNRQGQSPGTSVVLDLLPQQHV